MQPFRPNGGQIIFERIPWFLALLLGFFTAICLIMETKLAVPIAAKDLEKARQQVKAAISTGAELLELRTDYLEGLSVEMI